MDDYYAGDHGDVAMKEAAAELRSRRAQRERWRTKDGREIPYSALGDEHLLNILRLLQREAVVRAAARVAEMIREASPFGPRGDGAALAYEAEFDNVLEADWKDETGPEWAGLMKEARRRPTTLEEAIKIALADLRQAQLAVELRMIGS